MSCGSHDLAVADDMAFRVSHDQCTWSGGQVHGQVVSVHGEVINVHVHVHDQVVWVHGQVVWIHG